MRKFTHSRLLNTVLIIGAALLLMSCSGNQNVEEETEPETVHDMEAAAIDELSYGGSDDTDWDKALSDNAISKDFADSLSQFSFRTAGELLIGSEQDQVFSPLSIYMSLSLLQSGAEGAALEELDSLLRIKDPEGLADQCRRLITSLSYAQQRYRAKARSQGISDSDCGLTLADSLWFSRGLPVKEDYIENASKNFYASTYAVNFENPDADARIEYWIRDMTNDILRPRINLPADTVLAIVNTMYFYGAWQTPFDEEATVEDMFTLDDGESTVTASYCCRTEPEGKVYIEDGCMVSSLKTSNGCEMVVMLPDADRTVDDYLNTPDKLRSLMEHDLPTECSLTWKIPRFSFGSSYSLPAVLKKMGVTAIFGANAGFTGISDEDISVSDILHQAHIALDENGVEGAAYTLISMNTTSLMPDRENYSMICDHPFIFGIREKNTGAWLFLGVCRNPVE